MLWSLSLLPLVIIFPKYAKESYRVNGLKYVKMHSILLLFLIACEFSITYVIITYFKQDKVVSYNILNVILILLNLTVLNKYHNTYLILKKVNNTI